MRKHVLCLALIGLLAWSFPGIAEICTIDDVPAATLLLPYFEVDLSNNNNNNGVNTLFSINNASASAAVAHVTLWTDQSIPTLDFDVYLTGYDVQTISIRDIFTGNLRHEDGARWLMPTARAPGYHAGPEKNRSWVRSPRARRPSDGRRLSVPASRLHQPGDSTTSVPPTACCPHGRTSASAAAGGDSAKTRAAHQGGPVTKCNCCPPSATYFSGGIADTGTSRGDYFYVPDGQNSPRARSGPCRVLQHAPSTRQPGLFAARCNGGIPRWPWCRSLRVSNLLRRYESVPVRTSASRCHDLRVPFINGGGHFQRWYRLMSRRVRRRYRRFNGPLHAERSTSGWFPP